MTIKKCVLELNKENKMEINLRLYNHIGIFELKKVVLNCNETLKVKFSNNLERNLEYFAKTENGNIEIKNNEFEINDTTPRAVNITIYATKNGEIVKSWDCESLIITNLEDKKIISGQLNDFKQEYDVKYKELFSRLESLEKEMKTLHKLVYADCLIGE